MTTFALAFGGLTLLLKVLGRPGNTSLISSIALTEPLTALIGASIIREVRQIAHTQLIAGCEAEPARQAARPDFAAVGAQKAASDAAPACGQALVRTD